jgi:hypothetical protein
MPACNQVPADQPAPFPGARGHLPYGRSAAIEVGSDAYASLPDGQEAGRAVDLLAPLAR